MLHHGGPFATGECEKETTMEIRPIPSTFAAEIVGADLSQPLGDADRQTIAEAMDHHGVLVARDQKLDNETQAAFARQFGELEVSSQIYRSANTHRVGSQAIIDVSNIGPDNKPRDREDRQRLESLSNRLWHSDASFRPIVGALSMLFAHVVTPGGGETEFADTRAGYDGLPEETKALIADLRAEHVYGYSRAHLGFPSHSEEEQKALPPVQHPLVRTHAGRKALYLGSHASHIAGWPVPEGRALLFELLEHTTQPQFRYRHAWRVGDFVIWDNRTTLHRGLRFDPAHPRDLRRVTTRDVPDTQKAA
jgi:alpha-ketoglutarate-dependent 2,4-dichlorophenoxyacetate dioxygenase